MAAASEFSKSAELQSRAKRLYEDDRLSFKDIAPMMGCSKDVVQRHAARSGWRLHTNRNRSRGFKFSEAQKQEIVSLYKRGLSAPKIAEKFHLLKDAAVYRVLKDHDICTKRKSLTADITKLTRAAQIRAITRQVYNANVEIINPKGLVRARDQYALDHVYSVSAAVSNRANLRVPLNLFEVCHPANLRLIPFEENRSKAAARGTTAAKLRDDINAWNLRYGEPYFCRSTPVIEEFLEQERFDNYGRQIEDLSRGEIIRGYYYTSDGTQC